MKRYRLVISQRAIDSIADHRDYLARSSGSDDVAASWVKQVLEHFKVLETMPAKFGLAEENDSRSFEIRRLLIGNYIAHYTIDDAYRVVRIVGFRHGARLPRSGDLPDDLGG